MQERYVRFVYYSDNNYYNNISAYYDNCYTDNNVHLSRSYDYSACVNDSGHDNTDYNGSSC